MSLSRIIDGVAVLFFVGAILHLVTGCVRAPTSPGPADHTLAVLQVDTLRVVCGAVQVGPRTAVTALHCAHNAALTSAERVEYGYAAEKGQSPVGGRRLPVERRSHWWGLPSDDEWVTVTEVAPADDLALLQTAPVEHWAHVAQRPAVGGVRVVMWHHGEGRPWQYSTGQLDTIPVLNRPLGVAALPSSRGQSGGGIWLLTGELTGIVVAGKVGRIGVTYADVRAVLRLLEGRPSKVAPPQSLPSEG